MKKHFLTLCIILATAFMVNAQQSLFNKGDKALNLGIGLGSTLYIGKYYTSNIPPLSASLEMGVVDNMFDVENLNIGVGGYLGFSTYTYRYVYGTYNYGWNYTNIIIGARGVVHYPLVDKMDTYAGLLVGPRIVLSREFGNVVDNTASASGSGIAYSYFVGARYYFSENFGLMGEVGYGISYLNLGVTLKL